MKLFRSLNWPAWFLGVLATLGQNNDPIYVLSRVAAIVVAGVSSILAAIVLPPWSMFVALPGAWILGAWWVGYCSDKVRVRTNHDVYASCITVMLAALLRLGFWWLFKF